MQQSDIQFMLGHHYRNTRLLREHVFGRNEKKMVKLVGMKFFAKPSHAPGLREIATR